MKIACYTMFALGLLSYITSLFFIGTNSGEMYSDIGNALLLITAVVLLFRLQSSMHR